jgi:O-antigen/teichoic acid export membrane protein
VNRNILVRNALAAAGQTVIQTAVLFLVYRYLVHQLGIEQVGVWAVVLATASAARISELGLAGSVTRFVASYRAAANDQAASEIVQTAAISVAAILGVILVAIYPALFRWMPSFLPAEAVADGRAILPYALASMWLGTVSAIWLSGLDGCLRSDIRAVVVILSTILFLVLVLATVPDRGLVGLAIAQVGQGLIMIVAGWVALKRTLRPLPLVPASWRRSRFREMLSYGVNVQIITVVMLLFEPVTKVLFARYGGLPAAGYFELAQQLVMKIRSLIVESNRVVIPVMAGMEELGQKARHLYARNFNYLLVVLTPLFAVLAGIIPAISEWWLGSFQTQFVIMGVCLTAAWYLNSLTAPAYFAYMGQGRLRWLTTSHLVLGVSNLVLGLTLGPAFGWQGVLAAFVISLAAGSFIPVLTYNREQQLTVRSILSKSDVLLLAICGGASLAAILAYSSAARAGAPLWPRVALLTVATMVILAAAWRHPLMPRVLAIAKRDSRGADKITVD